MTTVQELARQHELPPPVVVCPYCSGHAKLVKGDLLYRSFAHLHGHQFWYCEPCQAWVGCHHGTDRPLGTLANEVTRKLRRRVHALFDSLWVKGRAQTVFKSRTAAYRWLAQVLEIPAGECHVSMFDEERCMRAIFTLRAEWTLRGFVLPKVEQS